MAGQGEPLLVLDAVSVPADAFDPGLAGASLALAAGELALVTPERGRTRLPLADLAAGLLAPAAGRVLFRGREWREMRPDEAARTRSRIGRVFAERGWISNLDVAENVTLAARHHTTRPLDRIREEAEALARKLGLPGLPAGRPAGVPRTILRKAEWVRAFLGEPRLLLLERPEAGVEEEALPLLAAAVGDARRRGAAVLWITGEAGTPAAPTLRLRLRGPELRPWEEEP